MKNHKVRYYLEPKSKNLNARTVPELIMAEISYGYCKLDKSGKKRYRPARFSLQVNILPSKFGLKDSNFIFNEEVFRRANINNATVRTKMLQLETALIDLSTGYISAVVLPTPNELTAELSKRMRTEVVSEAKISILDYLYTKIKKDTENSTKSMKNSKDLNTIKTFVTVSHLIENFQIATGETLFFEKFDEKSYWHLWDILDDVLSDKIKVVNPNQPKKQRKQSYGYLVVTLRKYQKSLIQTLKEAKKEGNITPLDLYDSNLILQDVKASKEFFMETELLKSIIQSDVTYNPTLQNAKDYLIIASLSGMRYESMKDAEFTATERFSDNNYDFQYIHSIQNKTSTEVLIPLLKPVTEILAKRGFPKIMSNSTVNGNLKELFKVLKINRMEKVTKVTYKSGKIETEEPLSTLISTHDCKGTFYGNLYALNVAENVIDNITHPDRTPKNPMAKVYNKTKMLIKAKLFVDEVNKVQCDVYTF